MLFGLVALAMARCWIGILASKISETQKPVYVAEVEADRLPFWNYTEPRFVTSCPVLGYLPFEPTQSVRQRCVSVLVRQNEPYANTDPPEGVDLAVLAMVARRLDFVYTLTDFATEFPDLEYEGADSVNEVIRILSRKQFDLAIGGLSSRSRYKLQYLLDQNVTFAEPYLHDYIILLQRRVVESMTLWTNPATTGAAACGVASLFLVALTLLLTRLVHKAMWKTTDPGDMVGSWEACQKFLDALLDVWYTATNKSIPLAERQNWLTTSQKILLAFFWFAAVVWLTVHTGFMASHSQFQYTGQVVEDLNDLSRRKDLTIATSKRSSVFEWLQSRNDSPYSEIMQRLYHQDPSVTFIPEELGVRRLVDDKSGSLVFLGLERKTLFRAGKVSLETCGFHIADKEVGVMWKAFAMPLHSDTFRNELSRAMFYLRARGIPEKLYQRYSQETPLCQSLENVALAEEEGPIALIELRYFLASFVEALVSSMVAFGVELYLAKRLLRNLVRLSD